MATISVEYLRLDAIIGINPDERTNKQEVIVDYHFDVDISKAAQTDAIEDCVNYKTVNKTIIKMVKESTYFTLEKLCSEVLHIIQKTPGINSGEVTVSKPGALRFTQNVSVTDSFVNVQKN